MSVRVLMQILIHTNGEIQIINAKPAAAWMRLSLTFGALLSIIKVKAGVEKGTRGGGTTSIPSQVAAQNCCIEGDGQDMGPAVCLQ